MPYFGYLVARLRLRPLELNLSSALLIPFLNYLGARTLFQPKIFALMVSLLKYTRTPIAVKKGLANLRKSFCSQNCCLKSELTLHF